MSSGPAHAPSSERRACTWMRWRRRETNVEPNSKYNGRPTTGRSRMSSSQALAEDGLRPPGTTPIMTNLMA